MPLSTGYEVLHTFPANAGRAVQAVINDLSFNGFSMVETSSRLSHITHGLGSLLRMRHADGSAGDADYGMIGTGYRNYRQPEPEIARAVHRALDTAVTVLNVGAGTGSYEPIDRKVTAVEPSSSMRAQRPADYPRAVDAAVEELPFADDSFDAAMAIQTVHQWTSLARGLAEVRRVTRGPVVVLAFDPSLLHQFWLARYAPELIEAQARRDPPIEAISGCLGGRCTVAPVPIPLHCSDGFAEAYYGRPEQLLDRGARQAHSAWSFVSPEIHDRFEYDLGRDLAEGRWDAKYGHLRSQSHYLGSLTLLVAH